MQRFDQALIEFINEPFEQQMLSGGLTNQCLKITTQSGRQHVWRPFSFKHQAFNLSPQREFYILNALADFELSPKVFYWSDQGILLEWLDGSNIHQLSVLQQLELMRHVQQFSQANGLNKSSHLHHFNITACIDHYWQGIEVPTKKLTKRYETYRQPLATLIERSHQLAAPQLAHFDLGKHNLIQTKSAIKIIDWEYAAITFPALDLALMITGEGWDLPSTVDCYCQLTEQKNTKQWQQVVKDWQPHLNLMRDLWFALNDQLDHMPQAGQSNLK